MNALRKYETLQPYTGPAIPHPPCRWWHAPKHSYRAVRRLSPTDTIVIHATAGGSSAGAMSVAQQGKASWHALIPDEDEPDHGKRLIRCVPTESAAWHVLSRVKHPADGRTNINDRSLGVELVNRQDGTDHFSDWQLAITAQLVAHWCSILPIRYLCTHAYLDPGRKLDPGELFDWERFMGYLAAALAEPQAVWKLIWRPTGEVVDAHLTVSDVSRVDLRPVCEKAGLEVWYHPEQRKVYFGPPDPP